MPNTSLAVLLLIPTMFFTSGVYCVGPAALMQVTPQRMRGQAGAMYIFVMNLIGLGLGPTSVALCTDYLFRDGRMVGYSLLIVTAVTHVIAGALLWHGRHHFVKTLEATLGMAGVQTA